MDAERIERASKRLKEMVDTIGPYMPQRKLAPSKPDSEWELAKVALKKKPKEKI